MDPERLAVIPLGPPFLRMDREIWSQCLDPKIDKSDEVIDIIADAAYNDRYADLFLDRKEKVSKRATLKKHLFGVKNLFKSQVKGL